jgi:hypothetical protein
MPSGKSILVATNAISPCRSFGCLGMGFGCFARGQSKTESVAAGAAELILVRNRPAQTVRNF